MSLVMKLCGAEIPTHRLSRHRAYDIGVMPGIRAFLTCVHSVSARLKECNGFDAQPKPHHS